jgi:hypothetical protein
MTLGGIGLDDQFRDKFKWQAGSAVMSQCWICDHLTRDSPLAVCAAFPGGIPVRILTNEEDHRVPWIDPRTGQPGDRGGGALKGSILFTPRPGVEPDAVDRVNDSLNALPRHDREIQRS